MSKDSKKSADTVLLLGEQPVSGMEVIAALSKERKLSDLVKRLVLDRILSTVEFSTTREEELLNNFRQKNNLESDESFLDFLQKNYITEALFREELIRPHRVVKFREERWGPRANSLYLKHKERYDSMTYRLLQSDNADIMQEVYFRLKDKEDSWDNLAKQFPNAGPESDARMNSMPVADIEPALVEALRKAGPGIVIKPLQINTGRVVVAELESIEASRFDEKIRNLIIRQEFESWYTEECNKALSRLKVSA